MNKPNYTINFSSLGNDQGMISDNRLAFALAHQKNAVTELLSTDIDGETYTLVLAEKTVLKRLADNSILSSETGQSALSDEWLTQIQAHPDQFKVDQGAWFEWLDSQGDSPLPVFDEIHIDPVIQIEALNSALQSMNDEVRPGF